MTVAERKARDPEVRRTPALATVCFALAIAGLALALLGFLPRARSSDDDQPGVRVVLFDASASVRRVRSTWGADTRAALAAAAGRALERGELLVVVRYAERVDRLFGPADPATFADWIRGQGRAPFDPRPRTGADGGTALHEALALASELLREVPAATLEIHGDGTYTAADPGPLLARLAADGVVLERYRSAPADRGDLGVLALELPPRVEEGAPLAARVELDWRPPLRSSARTAELAVLVTSGGVQRPELVTVDLPPGGGRFVLPLALGRADFGRNEVRVRAVWPGDPVPENDERAASTRAEGGRVLGLVARAEDRGAAHDWLAPSGSSALPGLTFVDFDVGEVAGALEGLDALISFDVAPVELPSTLLADFVQRGGGWLCTGGWGLLEDWAPGAPATPLSALLPLEPAPLERGPRDVVLLVDGSGSMAGEPFETVRAASLELVAAALPSDRVELRFFTAGLEPPHLLKERRAVTNAVRDDAARELFAVRVPGGTTFLVRSLEQFARTAAGSERETLALLLTDGVERDNLVDPAARVERLHASLLANRVRLVVIGVGDTEDHMLGLLSPDSPVQRADGLDDLARVFRREVSGARWKEAEPGSDFAVVRAEAPPDALVRTLDAPTPAPLRRFIKNRLRPGAELVWTEPEGAPLLAVQRVGEGRTACLSSLPDAEWAPAWTGIHGAGEPAAFGPLLRFLARGGPRARAVRLEVEGAAGDETFVLQGADFARWSLASAQLFAGGARSEHGQALRFLPELTADGGLRYRARPPSPALAAAGAWVQIPAERPGEPDLVLVVPALLPPEFRRPERRLGALQEGAAEPAATRGRPRRAAQSHPAAPWALAFGLLALVATVLAGRFSRRPAGPFAGADATGGQGMRAPVR